MSNRATDRDGRRVPARVGRRIARRETERVDRALDRSANVLADTNADQAEIGLAHRNAVRVTSGDLARDRRTRTSNYWFGFARITPQLSREGRTGKLPKD